jgi:hypothetical protein
VTTILSFDINQKSTNSWLTSRAVKLNQNQIVFPYRIESFCSCWIESNADWIEWYFWFSKQFDSIRTERWTRKTLNCDSWKWRIQ